MGEMKEPDEVRDQIIERLTKELHQNRKLLDNYMANGTKNLEELKKISIETDRIFTLTKNVMAEFTE